MSNAKLITALRCCIVDFNSTQSRRCNECPYRIYADGEKDCENKAKRDAADALEEADARIAKLEARSLKKGERIPLMCTHPDGTTEHDIDEWYGELYKCSICHYVMLGEENYCPNCGARMRTVTECHTLEEANDEK